MPSQPPAGAPAALTFPLLVQGIADLDRRALLAAGRANHRILTLRNWLIGAWIVEYELRGEERAAYGERLFEQLAAALKQAGRRGLSTRNLHNCRRVTLAWPELDALSLARSVFPPPALSTPLEAESLAAAEAPLQIVQAPAQSGEMVFTALRQRETADLPWHDAPWLQRLFSELTFTHLVELARIDDPLERAFYELHCLKEGWGTRELIRQRNTMLYQRVGLSTHRDEVLVLARQGRLDERPEGLLRDPYVLEFLGLPEAPGLRESTLEQALIDHLQRFLLELGRDFCFVDRQFRITVGNRHHYLDLLFFHRRLRCLVAVDLKVGEFVPDHAGQMGFYLNYLRENVALPEEGPPIGLLLCTGKDEEVVHYATADDEALFVSRYKLALPTEAQLRQWLHEARSLTERRLREEDGDAR
ncbi:MAG: PDDEXK nuclease domain-containing protein [Pseudomonadota bacterium]